MIKRDTHSKALVATDTSELQKYRKEKKRDREMLEIKKEISSLKDCINNICETIKKIEAKV
jgi:hypothetical protein